MRTAARTRRITAFSIAVVTVAVIGAPAWAGDMLTWTTDDGTLAFTDDPKAVPERYRDSVQVRRNTGLADYQRYTPTDPQASQRYADGVQERLAAMRRFNAASESGSAVPSFGVAAPDAQRITLRPQGSRGPTLDVSPTTGDAPYVVEEVRYRAEGSLVTGPAVVVRQGDRTIAIVKERSRNTNVSRDIHTDRDLLP